MSAQHTPDEDAFAKAFDDAEEVVDALQGLVERTKEDATAPFELVPQLAELRERDPRAYERMRRGLMAVSFNRITALEKQMDKQLSSETPSEDAEKQSDALIRLAAGVYLFHTSEEVGYADINIKGHRETHLILSKKFKGFLLLQFLEKTDSAPNSEALRIALATLEARAVLKGKEHTIYMRVANISDCIYLDLGDAEHRIVKVSVEGWSIVEAQVDVRFRRAPGMQALPVPTRGGSLEPLRRLLHITTDEEFLLTVMWLIAALFGRGPFPVMVIVGEQGSAKSTRAKMLRALIDPNLAPTRSPFRTMQEAFIAASNGYVIALDNLSFLPQWMSDCLCCIATGGGQSYRELYTDADEKLFNVKRPQVINGIEDVAVRADLADRALFISPAPISAAERLAEDELWQGFEAVRPSLLGALLDILVHGLRRMPHMAFKELPRMADFAKLGMACETALGKEGDFMRAYDANLEEIVGKVLEADHVAMAVREFMEDRSEWSGTARELLRELEKAVHERVSRSKNWPNGPRPLSSRLRRAAPNLRKIGIEISLDHREGQARRRIIKITRSDEPTMGQPNGHAVAADATDATDAKFRTSDPPEKKTSPQRPKATASGPARKTVG